MAIVQNLAFLVLLALAWVSISINAVSSEDDLMKCGSTVRMWAASSLEVQDKDKHTLQDLLFFLHIPRTAGRTYFHCFLRKLYAGYLECPRSYDKFRFDPSKSDCRLMVTHDDYSVMSRLPQERTSVVTIQRNPVDRVFSTYEFSVEVAARFLVHPNLTSATEMMKRILPKNSGVSTLNIWPWKFLVPWMREDLFARRDARKHGVFEDESSDLYNMANFVMPLHEFVNDPIAHDIIHNGATFQVAGLTNNSLSKYSSEVRRCVRKHPSLGKFVLKVAKKRLDNMLYVGITENHKESATMFANMVGAQVLSQLQALNSSFKKSVEKPTVSTSFPDTEHDNNHLQNSTSNQMTNDFSPTGNVGTRNGTMTVGNLMEDYEVCISSLRKTQTRRRASSLKRISSANFSKEARLQVSKMVIQKIRSLNSLDLELYKHAQDIFVQQRKHLTERLVEAERQKVILDNSYEVTLWNVVFVVSVMLLLLILAFLLVNRSSSKLKV